MTDLSGRTALFTGSVQGIGPWLCAPIVHNVTGRAIPIDGGWTAQ